MKPTNILLLLFCVAFLSGCGAPEPEFTKVSGRLTKNGEPVNMVEVRFVPMDDTLNKYTGSGITDDDGNFVIAIPGRDEPVCCEGPCKVTLREAPVPGDIRGQLENGRDSGGGGNALMKYKASLKNRPIHRDYERLYSTPLKFDVSSAREEAYDIEM